MCLPCTSKRSCSMGTWAQVFAFAKIEVGVTLSWNQNWTSQLTKSPGITRSLTGMYLIFPGSCSLWLCCGNVSWEKMTSQIYANKLLRPLSIRYIRIHLMQDISIDWIGQPTRRVFQHYKSHSLLNQLAPDCEWTSRSNGRGKEQYFTKY